MARKEGNPVQTLLIVIIVLIVGLIAITLFWNQKTNGEKVGYFLGDDEPAPVALPPASPQTSPTSTTNV